MIKGVHHIGASVPNLEEIVTFYQQGADLTEAARFHIADNDAIDQGIGLDAVACHAALLSGRTAYLELLEFKHPAPVESALQPVYGPGVTHVCFQSPQSGLAYEQFRSAGMTMVSRNDKPVKLARPDITYLYARDTAGNLFELEQWDTPPKPYPLWIAHVALVSPNIRRLVNFYSVVLLGMKDAPEIRRIKSIPTLDVVADLDDVDLFGAWIPTSSIEIEIWQFVNPPTPWPAKPRAVEAYGYSHICFEVDELATEYERLVQLGVQFLSKPFQSGRQWMVYGRDPDGNLFELLQFLDPNARLSLDNLTR